MALSVLWKVLGIQLHVQCQVEIKFSPIFQIFTQIFKELEGFTLIKPCSFSENQFSGSFNLDQ